MIEQLYAMGQQQGGGGGGIWALLPFLLIILIIYWLMIRPQVKRQKEKQRMIDALKKGDRVITVGGIYGTIEGIREKDDTLIVKIADNVKVRVTKNSVSAVVQREKD
ncbi:MAG: preprotein translocase subunit YajC [Fidelibacterota bacterium]